MYKLFLIALLFIAPHFASADTTLYNQSQVDGVNVSTEAPFMVNTVTGDYTMTNVLFYLLYSPVSDPNPNTVIHVQLRDADIGIDLDCNSTNDITYTEAGIDGRYINNYESGFVGSECLLEEGKNYSWQSYEMVGVQAELQDCSCLVSGVPYVPPSPTNAFATMIHNGEDSFRVTTGDTMSNGAKWTGNNFTNLILGTGLAVLFELRYWIIALIVIFLIVYFAYRAYKSLAWKT